MRMCCEQCILQSSVVELNCINLYTKRTQAVHLYALFMPSGMDVCID